MKGYYWLTGIIILLFSFFVWADDLVVQLEQARLEKDSEKKIGLYSRIITQAPDAAEAYYQRSKIYKKVQDYEKAIVDLTRYIELMPGEFQGYYAKGRLYTRMKKYDLAAKAVTLYIQKYPKDPKGYFERGYIYRYFAKKMGPAIDDFSSVIELNPEDSTSFIERGLSYQGLGEFKRAIDDFTEAIRFDTDNSIAYRERGRCHKENHDFKLAINDFEKSLRFNADYVWTYYFLAATHYRIENLEEALKYADQALGMEQNHIIYEMRANIYRDMELNQKALADIEQAFKIGGEYLFTRGSIYFAMDDEKKAHTDFMEVYKKNEEADLEIFNKLIMDRVRGLKPFLSEVKDKYDELKRKYGNLK